MIDLLTYTKEYREGVLQGDSRERMCIALSAPLHAALCILGVPSQLIASDLGECLHIFLMLEDGRVLDPTADQFNWCSLQHLGLAQRNGSR